MSIEAPPFSSGASDRIGLSPGQELLAAAAPAFTRCLKTWKWSGLTALILISCLSPGASPQAGITSQLSSLTLTFSA